MFLGTRMDEDYYTVCMQDDEQQNKKNKTGNEKYGVGLMARKNNGTLIPS